ncbi:TPA: hypothetical protein ACWV6Y_005886, partial [Salmonella enterica subsp. enterica serovar Muenchen]
QKVFTTELHQGVAECHAVVSHRFVPFKIIVWITITLPDKPMALTILPNLHHVLRLYLPVRHGDGASQPEQG